MKLTKSEMQVVVDYLLVQHDTLFEMAVDKNAHAEDRESARKDEKVIRKFLLACKEKGLNIEHAMYSMERKVKTLEED